jgi:hypothetical protein
LREDLDERVRPTVAALMESARTHSKFSSRVRSDEFYDFESYLRRVAAKDKIEVGDVDLSPSEVPLAHGIVDHRYHVRPKDRDRGFSRLTLTNFLSELEHASSRVKVTSVKIENAEKRSKPEVVPDDAWTFEADVTSRQRKLD